MVARKRIEVFSAGCPACRETIEMLKRIAGAHEVVIRDMNKPEVAAEAKRFGIRSVPAVVIDGKLAPCCSECGPEEKTLRAALGSASGEEHTGSPTR